jgi:hypothetical protein
MRPLGRVTRVAACVTVLGLGTVLAGCGGGSEPVLSAALSQVGLQIDQRSVRTYEGAFALADNPFICGIRATGAYCLSRNGSVVVSVKDSGDLTSGPSSARILPPALGGRSDVVTS